MYKIPVSVLVLVYTHAGEVLLLRRKDLPDFWQSITGSVEPGETFEQAALRELKEETGLAPRNVQDLHTSVRFPIKDNWRSRYAPEVTHNEEHWFSVRLDDTCDIQLQPEEHLEYQWVSYEQALSKVSSSTNRQALETLRGTLG
ncbi:MAG: dihydroneopterin triphosphate diphosphatase [Gammaproteobacteria bacterium]|nr:dihydroneopterin triphosphate diphosphatase [Gammaproteobacteria bacterium]